MTLKHDDYFRDRLGQMFELQEDLQRNAYGAHPGDIKENSERIQFIKDMILALEDELHEAMFEIGWKPWATSKHIREDAVRAELVDAFHFFMNLCLAVNMTPEDLYQGYLKKRAKNAQRQAEGYDGQSTKCPKCTRAYDDDAVGCSPGVCEIRGEYITIDD